MANRRCSAVVGALALLSSGCTGGSTGGGTESTPESRATAVGSATGRSRDVLTTPTEEDAAPPAPGRSVDGVAGRPLVAARFVERDGVVALEVIPEDLVREAADEDVYREAWRRVVAVLPEADTPGMREQFLCHATFAPQKDSWYLEPARPAVGYWRTVQAGCNPGDVVDAG